MSKRRDAIAAQLASLRDVVAGFGEDDRVEQGPGAARPTETEDTEEARTPPPDEPDDEDLGEPGRPFSRHSPFYVGFFGGLGALLAFWLGSQLLRISSVLVLIVVAMFLAAGLNPVVEFFMRRGLKRTLRRAGGDPAGRWPRSPCSCSRSSR